MPWHKARKTEMGQALAAALLPQQQHYPQTLSIETNTPLYFSDMRTHSLTTYVWNERENAFLAIEHHYYNTDTQSMMFFVKCYIKETPLRVHMHGEAHPRVHITDLIELTTTDSVLYIQPRTLVHELTPFVANDPRRHLPFNAFQWERGASIPIDTRFVTSRHPHYHRHDDKQKEDTNKKKKRSDRDYDSDYLSRDVRSYSRR